MNKWLVSITGMAVAAGAMAVDSANIVGYVDEEFNSEYRINSVKFVPVGGDAVTEFNITNIMDATTIADYADELQIYDPTTGDFVTYIWDTENWIDSFTDDPLDVMVVPGSAFLCIADTWRFAGQVPSTGTIDVAVNSGEYTLVGGGLPIEATLANFDWTPMADYADELQLYDATTGEFITYIWDTTQWIDSFTDDPLDFDTPVTGFFFLTNEDSITESVTPYDYGA